MKQTLMSLFRPGQLENDVENKKEEQSTTMETTRSTFLSNSNSTEPRYPSVNYDSLKSEIFTSETNQVKVAEPRDYDDAEIIGESIKAGKITIVLLDSLKDGNDRRVLDFIGGLCYAYNIAPFKIDDKKWVVDPQHKRNRSFGQ